MNKVEQFQVELGYIKDETIQEDCRTMIELLPDYFFEVPASSTGKYHPSYSLGKGGLLRHTKAAVRIGYELLQDFCIGDKYTSLEKDIMLMGLLLHDGLKSGLDHSKYTRFDHPILMANYIMEHKADLLMSDEEIELLCSVVRTHMGPWIKDYSGEEVLEAPKSKYQNFVHMCDYLASRKFLLVPFDDNNNISV